MSRHLDAPLRSAEHQGHSQIRGEWRRTDEHIACASRRDLHSIPQPNDSRNKGYGD